MHDLDHTEATLLESLLRDANEQARAQMQEANRRRLNLIGDQRQAAITDHAEGERRIATIDSIADKLGLML